MKILTVRELRERPDALIRNSEEGKLSVLIRDGAPVFIAVPFDELLFRGGLSTALAVHLFDEQRISLGKAAQLAGMSRSEFGQHLDRLGVSVIRTTIDDLEQELASFGH